MLDGVFQRQAGLDMSLAPALNSEDCTGSGDSPVARMVDQATVKDDLADCAQLKADSARSVVACTGRQVGQRLSLLCTQSRVQRDHIARLVLAQAHVTQEVGQIFRGLRKCCLRLPETCSSRCCDQGCRQQLRTRASIWRYTYTTRVSRPASCCPMAELRVAACGYSSVIAISETVSTATHREDREQAEPALCRAITCPTFCALPWRRSTTCCSCCRVWSPTRCQDLAAPEWP